MSHKNMDRRSFLKTVGMGGTAALLSAITSQCRAKPKVTRKPNIILVYADDLDFDQIGIYDHRKFPCEIGSNELGYTEPRYKHRSPKQLTPHIDGLARDGAMLTRFYVTSAICTPSRYSILTGRYASRNLRLQKNFSADKPATIMWNMNLQPKESNIAKSMKSNGYVTGMVGKWHLGAPHGRVLGVGENDDPRDPKVARILLQTHERVTKHIRDKIGFDYADRIYFKNKEFMGLPKSLQVHNLEWLTEGALEFIKQNRNHPFFLYMPLTTPHGIYWPEFLKHNKRYTPAGVLDKAPQGQRSRHTIAERLVAADMSLTNAMGTWIDDSVGAILTQLEKLGLAEDTVFIFTSDHQSRGKYTCYEGNRVPFVIRWPGKIDPGTTIDSICANIDLPATFAAIAGITLPADMTRDGRSILPVLLGEKKSVRDSLLLECGNTRAVVTDRWKYIANRPPEEVRKLMEAEARECAKTGSKRLIDWDGRKSAHELENGIRYDSDHFFPHYFDYDQLYDLKNDPFEQENLANKREHAGTLSVMKSLLKDKLNDLPHPFHI